MTDLRATPPGSLFAETIPDTLATLKALLERYARFETDRG